MSKESIDPEEAGGREVALAGADKPGRVAAGLGEREGEAAGEEAGEEGDDLATTGWDCSCLLLSDSNFCIMNEILIRW